MQMQEKWSIDPNKSCIDQCDIKDKCLRTERYYQIEDTPLKDISADDLSYMLDLQGEMLVHHRLIYRIEWYRRNFIHVIDNLKTSLENGEVDIFEMEYLKRAIMRTFDKIYDDDYRYDIVEEVNQHIRFKR